MYMYVCIYIERDTHVYIYIYLLNAGPGGDTQAFLYNNCAAVCSRALAGWVNAGQSESLRPNQELSSSPTNPI